MHVSTGNNVVELVFESVGEGFGLGYKGGDNLMILGMKIEASISCANYRTPITHQTRSVANHERQEVYNYLQHRQQKPMSMDWQRGAHCQLLGQSRHKFLQGYP